MRRAIVNVCLVLHIADVPTGRTLAAHMGWDPMNVLWTATGAAFVTWVVARVWWRSYAPQGNALGSVSEQWLAEHRLDRSDSQR